MWKELVKGNGWGPFLKRLQKESRASFLPSVSLVALENNRDPFLILVSTILSLRTKDKVTLQASSRLFAKATTPEMLMKLSEEEIETLIYPVGFFKQKAKTLVNISKKLVEEYKGKVPCDREILESFSGIGPKTATLVLSLGWGIQAICVDTHVHRVVNRMGFVQTKKAEKTEKALIEIVPKEYWSDVNEPFVLFGQSICKPVSPLCSSCFFRSECKQRNVKHFR